MAGDVARELSEDEPPRPAGEEGPGNGYQLGGLQSLAHAFQTQKFRLAIALLVLNVILTIAVGIVAIANKDAWERVNSLLAPFNTLLGIAVGYYFASEKKN